MAQVTITLTDEEYTELEALAEKESRTPELQGRYLLRRSLGVERDFAQRAKTIPVEVFRQDGSSAGNFEVLSGVLPKSPEGWRTTPRTETYSARDAVADVQEQHPEE